MEKEANQLTAITTSNFEAKQLTWGQLVSSKFV